MKESDIDEGIEVETRNDSISLSLNTYSSEEGCPVMEDRKQSRDLEFSFERPWKSEIDIDMRWTTEPNSKAGMLKVDSHPAKQAKDQQRIQIRRRWRRTLGL